MKTAQGQAQISNLIGFYENMVMVRQNTPCVKRKTKGMTNADYSIFAFSHSRVAVADNACVFVATCRDQILVASLEVQVRRRMPR